MFSQSPWHGVVVASDTTKIIPGSGLSTPRVQYNYAARYVIERISARAAQLQEEATIYFEDRRNFNLVEFRDIEAREKRDVTDAVLVDQEREGV